MSTIIELPPQYVCHRDKVPIHHVTGHAIDPHDPKHWMDYRTAVATSKPFGFVLTAADPYFLLDLDKCHDGTQWSPQALAILGMFPGAMMEVSLSGRGLHILGRCNAAALADRRNKWDGWLELYTSGRFVAFGHGWQGNPDLDWTAQLLALVPQRPAAPALSPMSGVCPVPDDVALERLLRARSAASAFDGRPAPADLWHARVDVLARSYPSPRSDTFDRSSADAALMAHLAFWTCRDPAAMDRLFRRSALMRQKYDDREDYRNSTISGAINVTTDVAKYPKPDEVILTSTSNYLTIPQQIEYFAGCTYVTDQHRMLVPTGELLKPDQFRARWRGCEFSMQADGARPTRNAFEAFTENRAHRFPKVQSTTFRPDRPFGETIGDRINIWRGWTIQPDPMPNPELRCARLIDHMREVVFGEHAEWVLDWFAHIVQRPAEKPGTAIIVRGEEGAGKDFPCQYVGRILERYFVTIADMKHLLGQFNEHMRISLLANVTDSTWGGDRAATNKLKAIVTETDTLIERKGVDAIQADNFIRLYFTTNEEWAISASRGSRRWFVVEASAARCGDRQYFDALAAEMNGGGPAAFLAFLRARTITHDLRLAPATDALAEQRLATLRGAEAWLAASIDAGELLGMVGAFGWPVAPLPGATLREACEKWLRDGRHRGEPPSPKKFASIIAPYANGPSRTIRVATGAATRGLMLRPLHECQTILDKSLGRLPRPPQLALVRG